MYTAPGLPSSPTATGPALMGPALAGSVRPPPPAPPQRIAPTDLPPAEEIDLRWRSTREHALSWTPPAVPTLVVAPHPHDEASMFGGLTALQRSRGVDVTVLAVTDGEAAHHDVVMDVDLATLRASEQAAALRALGVEDGATTRLRLPDGDIASHESALCDAIYVAARRVGLIAAPWGGEADPDAQVCAAAAAQVARRTGIPLVRGLFRAWRTRHPVELGGARLLRLDLPVILQDRRHRAMAQHRSQVGDVVIRPPRLSHDDLEPVRWPSEMYLDAVDALGDC